MTQISASGLNCSRARSLNEGVAAACIFALIRYRLQARWSKGINVPTSPSSWLEWNIVVPPTNRYSLTGNTTIKLTQAQSVSNLPSETTLSG
jgi:hypothetical protein